MSASDDRPSKGGARALSGTFALPGATEQVTAELVVRETGPLARELLISFAAKATGRPIVRFDEELTQELHLLAIDDAFSSFVHEHAARLGPDGRFRVAMRFPKPGTYHVYADAVPTDIGQQVIRFALPVGLATVPAAPQQAPAGVATAVATGNDGPYSVELDTGLLRVGMGSMLGLTILKDGLPATGLERYLGVPAHAVFVNTDDLGYVHAHAMAAGAANGSHAPHGFHDAPEALIPATLMLHLTLPRAGQYALWIQFKAGGQVRTVRSMLTVPAAP